jgi:DNA-binding transcriptional MerR regulator
MLRIGEFSFLSGISIHMLRNYDKIGLLVPEYTDIVSGYRYYSEKQIPAANQIQVLKGLGFGLKEISSIQISGSSNEKTIERINKKIIEKQQESAKIHEQIKRMQQAIKGLACDEECALAVTVKQVPARKVVSLRGVIHRFQDEGLLWSELADRCRQQNIKLLAPHYSYAITHEFDLSKSYIDVEVQKAVEKMGNDTDRLRFYEVPECEVAAVAFQGVYSKLSNINTYMANWICKNGYALCGQAFTTYYISPENESNPENFITEVCFPIKK